MSVVRRALRSAVLAAILGVALVVVPDSGVHPMESALVKVEVAEGVDIGDLAHGEDVITFLAVGSDARPGEDMLRTRGDALHMIFLNTKTGAAADIGIPRDSYVPIPGAGSDRINAALYYGGPDALGQAVGNLVGVQPDYVFVTRFLYFQHMIQDIGGVTVDNPRAFADAYMRPEGFAAGEIHLNGQGALQFARARKELPGGDFDRSANQSRIIAGIQRKIRDHQDDKGFIARGVLSVMENLHTDLAPSELFRIAHAIADVDPAKVTSCVVHGGFANIGGASVVTPDTAAARRYGDDARNDATIKSC
ncbi:LCP family protein required for cell wall assembly [Nocardioides thalensis]|uniref:LCP family protein required for cell wall assembly n=1 Tax=Nocardioides thalensis TaxID=1914755 RepID=A0A853C6J3_9ACTN|nr:LCP family protein required for cell wall assembly [Nocardioides thalensis]